jgi:methyltransferase (TIGR00027 family)
MEQATPSRTALRVALRRSAHQLYDSPVIFEDAIAVSMLGEAYAEELRQSPMRPDWHSLASLRALLVARSRYAEDNLARAVAAGVQQYVLLGAGLDTFAHRNPYAHLRVFEVDHPATQAWKRALLASNGVATAKNLTFVPVDFERQSLVEQLQECGFDGKAAAFFSWLGVVPYLTLTAFRATMQFLQEQAAGSGVVFDYGLPRAALSPHEQIALDFLAARVQRAGEPFQLFFTPEEMARELSGFRRVEDIGSAEINARYFQDRTDQLAVRGSGPRLVCAWI